MPTPSSPRGARSETRTKLAIVAEIHRGAPRHAERGDRALDLMAGFADAVRWKPSDGVPDLGDRITEAGYESDLRLGTEVSAALDATARP